MRDEASLHSGGTCGDREMNGFEICFEVEITELDDRLDKESRRNRGIKMLVEVLCG